MTELEEALKALTESRAAFADSETKRAELEAVIEKVRVWRQDWVPRRKGDHPRMLGQDRLDDLLDTVPSVVLQDRDREVAAGAWEEGRLAQAVSIFSPINPYREASRT